MKRMYEAEKMDIGLVSQALNNTNAAGRYFSLQGVDKVLAELIAGAMAATKTTKIELLQAKDAAGTDAKGIPTTAGQAAVAEVTANTNVTVATLTLATVLATQTVTINGVTFTAHADTTTAANREFKIDGDDTADAAALAGLINHGVYGVPGVTATAALGVITLTSTVSGETLITAAASHATITVATVQAQAFVEISASSLDLANGFTHVAVKVTTTANTVVSASLRRGGLSFTPAQKVGASAVL